jgi:hypothetical protein
MKVLRTKLTLTASGVDGSATASGVTDHIVSGMVAAVHIARGAAATTDVTIKENNEDPAVPVLTAADVAAAAWHYPVDTDSGLHVYVADYLEVTVAQANNDDEITVTIVWVE